MINALPDWLLRPPPRYAAVLLRTVLAVSGLAPVRVLPVLLGPLVVLVPSTRLSLGRESPLHVSALHRSGPGPTAHSCSSHVGAREAVMNTDTDLSHHLPVPVVLDHHSHMALMHILPCHRKGSARSMCSLAQEFSPKKRGLCVGGNPNPHAQNSIVPPANHS